MVGFNIDKKTISMDKNTTILVLEGQTNTLSGKLTLEMSDNKITKFTWKESINNDGQFDLSLIATNLQIIGGYGGSPYYIYGQGDGKGDFTIPEFKCKTIGKQMSNLTGILPADGSPTQYMLHKESVINIKGVTEGKKCGISCHLSY